MSKERLTIDEIIAHCKRMTQKFEKYNKMDLLENNDMETGMMKEYWEHRQVAKYLEELKQYRELDEQGLLLRLPVAVGSKVWIIMTGMTGKHPTIFTQVFDVTMIEYWGISVFPTKAEAEEKLRELEGK